MRFISAATSAQFHTGILKALKTIRYYSYGICLLKICFAHRGGAMKELINDVAVISLPHRDWSCEAVQYRVKIMPMPGVPAGGNHFFVMVEDIYELLNHEKSREVLTRIILSRYLNIPARRIHFIFFVKFNGAPFGFTVKMFNFERDDNRQPVIKSEAIDYSSNSAVCTMVMF